MENIDDGNVFTDKRNMKKSQGRQIYPNSSDCFKDNKQEGNRSGHVNEKKNRVLKDGYKEYSTRKHNVNAVYQSKTGIPKEVGQKILPAEGSGHEQQIPGQPNNVSVARDLGSQSPSENDFSRQTLNEVMKGGNDLEDKADFLKNIGSKLESAGLYFQAALRFLKGAFLLEPYSIEIAKHREITDSMFLYKKAALLWESAANDYEKCNEMAAAALAYKCIEVAFMRVVFSKATHVEKDRRELQMGLQNIHSGESPSSSSGSDVDSLYNQGMLDTGVGSRMRGYHALVARNRPNIERVLNVVEDVHMVFKASKKYQKAFAAATQNCEESKCAAGISLVQTVINFSFHDIEKLMHLVQLAMEAIRH
ncbi:hypothetical protein AQUCO_01700269v1 [Aquilegia coerulea]|uniref:CWZF3/5/7 THD domain-containing protein n=1 Tax=Aquilegia coerulea TaxID=218851 RepID=A0A2G5DM07_AQUCA|nr:hypothetical protein AQUCO_01700269v1 [Aquilegia coerulea]